LLFRDDKGVPVSKVWKGIHMMPASATTAKQLIENREYAMKDNPYGLIKEK